MKKFLLVCLLGCMVAGCAFHAKQPVDETYYKRSQSVAWPEPSN